MTTDERRQHLASVAPYQGPDLSQDDAALTRWLRQRRAQFDALRRSAFGHTPDPLAAYGEGFIHAADQQVEMTARLLRAFEGRLTAHLAAVAAEMTTAGRRSGGGEHVYEDTHGSDAGRESPDADTTITRSRSGIVTTFAVVTILCSFTAGVAVEHWRGVASSAGPALTAVDELKAVAANASADLATASGGPHVALGQALSGIAIINRVSTLPTHERTALSRILTEIETNPGSETVLQIDALLAMPNGTRDAALALGERGTPALRADLLAVQQLAVERPVGGSDSLHVACLTGGPRFKQDGQTLASCLVQVPLEWGEADTKLREVYAREFRASLHR